MTETTLSAPKETAERQSPLPRPVEIARDICWQLSSGGAKIVPYQAALLAARWERQQILGELERKLKMAEADTAVLRGEYPREHFVLTRERVQGSAFGRTELLEQLISLLR